MDYATLNAMLTGRCSQQKKLERNTYAVRDCGNTIAVRLHRTNVLTFYPNGTVQFSTGGWETMTTKARLNEYAPVGWGVCSERGDWFLYRSHYHPQPYQRVAFFDGIRVNTRRNTVNRDDARKAAKLQKQREENRRKHRRALAQEKRNERNGLRIANALATWLFAFGTPERDAASAMSDVLYAHAAPQRAIGEAMENWVWGLVRIYRDWYATASIAVEVTGPEAAPPEDAIDAWHFVDRSGVGGFFTRHGRIEVRAGQTLHVRAPITPCETGLHASIHATDAMSFARGSHICRVKVWGNVVHAGAKLVAAYRRVEWIAPVDYAKLTNLSKLTNLYGSGREDYFASLAPTKGDA